MLPLTASAPLSAVAFRWLTHLSIQQKRRVICYYSGGNVLQGGLD